MSSRGSLTIGIFIYLCIRTGHLRIGGSPCVRATTKTELVVAGIVSKACRKCHTSPKCRLFGQVALASMSAPWARSHGFTYTARNEASIEADGLGAVEQWGTTRAKSIVLDGENAGEESETV